MNEQKYTILYFLDYGKSFGGAANTLLQQAILMKQLGYQVVVFFSDYLGLEMQCGYRDICLNLEIEYEWATYQISSQTEDIDVVCINKNYEKVKEKIVNYRPDILHSVQINPCIEMISRELSIPHIMNIYPLIPAFFSIQYINIFPHYHICDSWFYARKWKEYLNTDSTCIRTVANKNTKNKTKYLKHELRVICVGAIYKEKNQLTVIKAFHKALEHGIRGKLTICGYIWGDYGRECVQYVEDNNLQDSIIIKGFCSDMNKEYLDNDILICGSIRESYPNAISEAMANGLVVISTPVGGVPEVIIDGVNGYLTRDYSIKALYEKLMEIQNDLLKGKIGKILEETQKSFDKNHARQVITKQLADYYKYVLKDYKEQQKSRNVKELVGINEIRSFFNKLLQCYLQHERQFTDPGKVSLKLWYIYHIKSEILVAFYRKAQFYIWGAGKYGVSVIEMLDVFIPEICIEGFLDLHKEGIFQGYKIYNPEKILSRNDIVIFIASVNGQHEMIERLEENNKIFNKDYFILSARNW